MNIKTLGSLTVAALLLAACSNEEWLSTVTTDGVLKVSVEGSHSGTRAGFDKDGNFYWSNVDNIGVTSTGNANGFSPLKLVGGGGTASATFEGGIAGDLGDYAVYPCKDNNSGHRIDGDKLVYNFPASYKYDKVDVDFFTENQGEGNSFNPAMFGIIKDGNVTLKHLGGVICIKILKMPNGNGKLELIADKKITGEFEVGISDNPDSPMKCTAGEETATTGNTVTINFNGATANSSGVFYVPVPVGTYNLSIMVYNDEINPKFEVNAGTYTINRCDLKKIELREETANTVTSDNLAGATTDLGSHNIVSVKEEIAGEKEITIPEDNGSETSKSLSLQEVEGGASLTVKDENGNASGDNTSNSVDNFTLSIPNNESEDFTPLNVNIEMPNTTVTLAGNGGAARYGTVTAQTADNTLVVGSGVEVAEVVVVKGNVRVNKGATLKAISKGVGNNAKVIIYQEKDATIPTGLSDDDFEVIDVDVAVELHNVAAKGGEYTLTTDVTGDFVISAQDVTINLNGHTITNKTGDTFTVKKGSMLTIKGFGTVDNISHAKACIYNNGTVKLYGGTYTRSQEKGTDKENSGGNSYYNILNHGNMNIYPGVTVKQTGHFSSMISNGYSNYNSTDPRSGYVESINESGPTLRIDGGEFSGGLNTIKNDDNGFLEIIGGSFTNNTQSTIQNHHKASIQNGEFNVSESAEYVIQNHACEATHDKGIMTISGGKFIGAVVDNGTIASEMSIVGGTFSDPNVLHYLKKGATVKLAKSETAMKLSKSVELTKTNITIDLGGNTITSTGTQAFVVKEDAQVTIKNGQIGTSEPNDKLSYGVYAHKSSKVTKVTLENVVFSEMVMYAYNGAGGMLTATGCKFQGWLSGWQDGGTFSNCTFTKGKAWYPAAICYGNTTFTGCKFYRNNVDPDEYDAGTTSWGSSDSNGYFDCNYVVSASKGKTVAMSSCTFFNNNENESTGSVTAENHPYLTGWGDAGTWQNRLTIDGTEVTLSAE